jgi:hypothetical protein
VRVRLNRGRDRALVAEQVYWALLSLQQAGAVWLCAEVAGGVLHLVAGWLAGVGI